MSMARRPGKSCIGRDWDDDFKGSKEVDGLDSHTRGSRWVCGLCTTQAKMMMIEILKMTRQDLENEDYKVNGETVRINLELSPQKKSLDKTQTTFYSDFKDTRGDKFKIKSIWESMQVSSYVEVGPMNPLMSKWHTTCVILRPTKKNLKEGSSCTWLVLTVSVVNFFKCLWHCCRSNMEADKRTGGRTLDSEAKRDPRCTWQVWIARRSSTRQDQSILRRLWTIKKFTDALQRLCHEEWRIWDVRRPSKMLKSTFSFTGDVEAPGLWLKMTMQILWNIESEWRRKMWLYIYLCQGESYQIRSFMWLYHYWILSHSKTSLEQMMKDLIEEMERWELEQKLTSLWWTSTFTDEKMDDTKIRTRTGLHKLSFEKKFKILGDVFNQTERKLDSLDERMQSANKVRWRDMNIYRSKDIPWRVKCRRMKEQLYSAFCFGLESLSWRRAILVRIKV